MSFIAGGECCHVSGFDTSREERRRRINSIQELVWNILSSVDKCIKIASEIETFNQIEVVVGK